LATHKPVVIHELNGKLEPAPEDFGWYVVRTKARCEKKIADYAKRERITYYLPQIETIHKYQNRKIAFTKPMFSGYIFMMLDFTAKQVVQRTSYSAGFLYVKHQKELLAELRYIYEGRKNKAEFQATSWLSSGLEVEICKGPLKGMRGVVETHDKLTEVRLQVNILHQAVLVKVNPSDVKVLGEYMVVDVD